MSSILRFWAILMGDLCNECRNGRYRDCNDADPMKEACYYCGAVRFVRD